MKHFRAKFAGLVHYFWERSATSENAVRKNLLYRYHRHMKQNQLRFLFNLKLLCFSFFCTYLFNCTSADREAPQTAFAAGGLGSYHFTLSLLSEQGNSAFQSGDYLNALEFFRNAMDWSAKHADSLEYYNLMLDVACVNGRLGYLDKAIEMGNSVVDAHLRRKDTLSAAQGYVSLAAFYGEAGMPEESKNAMQRGFDIQKVQSDPILQSQAYNQMAFTYIDMLQWEQALLYLDTARIRLQFSKKQLSLLPWAL